MPKTNELSELEYRLIRVLDALGEEKRFLIFRNLLMSGSCFAEELSDVLKISRAALEKHVRRLSSANLINKRFVVEGGKARAKLVPTFLSKDVMECLDDLLKQTDLGTSLQEKAAEARSRVKAIKAVLNKLERRLEAGEIGEAEYRQFRDRYEAEMEQLDERMTSMLRGSKRTSG